MIILSIGNFVSLLLMGLDKLLAIKRHRRISESIFFGLACLGLGFGVIAGMVLFNHKTRKLLFRYGITSITILSLILLWLLFKYR